MAKTPLLECTFLMPIRRDKNLSDGKAHGRRAWAWLDRMLYEFGGATRATELYKGWYLDADTKKPVTDLSRKYVVAMPCGRLRRLRDLLRKACGVFQQKCIYLSIAGHVEFVEGLKDEDG